MHSTLGVNIDHVATIREARKGIEPEVVAAALIAEQAGAFGITVHLRHDRRHIQDRDVKILKEVVSTKLNLEMSTNSEIVDIAFALCPDQVTLVPENRQEVTTEGGLDMTQFFNKTESAIKSLKKKDIIVSLFIDPDQNQIDLSKKAGADYIEIHTGSYANSKNINKIEEFKKIRDASKYARSIGFSVNAGHGLDYLNTMPIAGISEIEELNIGHSIISRAVFTGLYNAVEEMNEIIKNSGIVEEWPY